MLKFIKKFVLDILPSVVATILGAYIVHHYVIPAATPDKPAAATASTESKQVTPDAAATDKPTFVRGVAEKAAIEKTATEKTAAENASPDSKRRHATSRATKPAASEQTASLPESATEERRDANGLARAAIERLRPPGESPRTEAPRTIAATPVQPAMPPLQPAVTLSPPSPEVFNAGTGAILVPSRPSSSPPPVHSADASRPLPPGTIPAAPPLELHEDIVTTTTGRAATVADDVMSAAKSVFHAVLPLK